MVWIGDPAPLLHPEIGRLARRIADSGRHVFVTTDGAILHRHIHEFRPVSRLFLTVQFHGSKKLHDQRVGREGAFRDALGGIRTAKLSGFLVCAQIVVYRDTEIAELEKLREILMLRDVDGFVVCSAPDSRREERQPAENGPFEKRWNLAQAQIPSRRWRWFSRWMHESLLAERMAAPSGKDEPDRFGPSEGQACEERVEAS